MKRTRWARIAGAGAVIATLLAFGARPALAAGLEGDSSSWADIQTGGLSCTTATGGWTCDTPSPVVAGGGSCVQTVHADVQGRSVTVPLGGCTATLSIPSWGWQGTFDCALGVPVGAGCYGAMAAGTAFFSFQPVLGESLESGLATITDAACTPDGGHATVTATLVDTGTDNVFQMDSTINWVGSCVSVSTFTWTGTLTVG